jgi:hypothetical protein
MIFNIIFGILVFLFLASYIIDRFVKTDIRYKSINNMSGICLAILTIMAIILNLHEKCN